MVPGGNRAVGMFLEEREMASVARRGELVDALARPALVAMDGDMLAGVLTYEFGPTDCEILALFAVRRRTGLGTALVEALVRHAVAAARAHCWLVTTNDNVDALRFYQRRGFRLSALRPGAVDEARRDLKSTIPMTGEYGIPLRDEIELVRDLPT
jgi:GNAT superfamily N-acetyltransferase